MRDNASEIAVVIRVEAVIDLREVLKMLIDHLEEGTLIESPWTIPGLHEDGTSTYRAKDEINDIGVLDERHRPEVMRLNAYYGKDCKFSYLRTKDDAEIDLIIERPGLPVALVEIKSTDKIDDRDTKTVGSFLKDFNKAEGFCLSRDPIPKKIGKISCLHWRDGLKTIFHI